jgi:AraC-like DNA-binding protein
MIRLKHLVQSSLVSVLRLDHYADSDHSDPEAEPCTNYAINIVESGSFGLETGKQSWRLSPGCVFLSQPGAVHRYTHHERTPSDVCLSVIYSETFIRNSTSGDNLVTASIPAVISPTNRFAFLKFQITQITNDGCALALEDWACELISTIRVGLPRESRLYRQRQLSWYAERVQAIRELFELRYAESHTLTSVARSVGMSPYQFARVFSQLAGLPPHQYLLSVRLERAAEMLLDGKSVTETCFDVGFSNLSHFTRSFQRRFGCRPSSLKTIPPTTGN